VKGAVALAFDEHGLVPVVVQDHLSGEVRMVAFASREALDRTLESGRATFWSRSRSEIWEKGLSSGNVVHVKRVLVDCDSDCLLYASDPHGPTCHTGAPSCFFQALERGAAAPLTPGIQTAMGRLEETLEARKASSATASYTKALYEKGAAAIAAKVREEAGELAHALTNESDARVVSEAADVVYHLMVGLRLRGVPWRDVLAELEARTGSSGHAEKASRASTPPSRV
jgi:phosphoribosyl-ATP pyrophosphohydrolase/phosphoribosyl-AMP cyclohydrolase